MNVKLQCLVLCASLVLSLAACGSAASKGSTASTTSTAAHASTGSIAAATEVVVQNYVFPAISAAPGATLTLVDRDLEPHTMTADDGTFKAGPFTDEKPGTLVAPERASSYPFHCEIHPTMHGTLVVNNP